MDGFAEWFWAEAFDTEVQFGQPQASADKWAVDFKVDDHEYSFVADSIMGMWRVVFCLKTPTGCATKMQGFGARTALGVMGGVKQAMEKFVSLYNPQIMNFSADASEPGKVRLYDRLAGQVARIGGYESDKALQGQAVIYKFKKPGARRMDINALLASVGD